MYGQAKQRALDEAMEVRVPVAPRRDTVSPAANAMLSDRKGGGIRRGLAEEGVACEEKMFEMSETAEGAQKTD